VKKQARGKQQAGIIKEDKPTGAAAYRAGDLVKRAVGTQPARMKASGAGE